MPTYSCPKDSCGFGPEPDKCVHGAWIRDGAAPPSPGPTRIKIPAALAAKLLGLRAQPAAPATQNRWMRDRAPVELVRARHRNDAAKVAAAKRQRRTMPLGPCVVDADGVPRSAAEFFNH